MVMNISVKRRPENTNGDRVISQSTYKNQLTVKFNKSDDQPATFVVWLMSLGHTAILVSSVPVNYRFLYTI